jgi:hypothetical protein
MKNEFYTGIGSRKTPKHILNDIFSIAQELAKRKFVLRSGGANGADEWFEKGCDFENGKKEIFLPWKNFNGNLSNLIVENNVDAFEIAKKFHPKWNYLKFPARKLMARNSQQVLGKDLKSPSCFVICYSEGSGGTEQALRIARHHNIPIFNLHEINKEELLDLISK